MKGKIRKSNCGWVVDQVVMHSFRHQIERLINTYPLHPYDIQKIEEQEKVFDNIEARIAAYPDVHFEIVNEFDNNGPEHYPKYAKLKDWDVTLNGGLESELRDYNTMNKLDRQKLVKKWESSGLLDNIKGEASNTDMVKLLECKATQLLDEPYVSDNFQIGPDGAYEHIEYAKSTMVFAGEGNWGRSAYIKLEDNKVIFDCSDEEYGPIVFDIDLLKDALNKHII